MGRACPLPPADDAIDAIDLFGYRLMPLDGRILRSPLWALARTDGRIAVALIALLEAAWRQIPAGSLPDDGPTLAMLSMLPDADWAEVRAVVLRDWYRGEDGRLRHPSLSEAVALVTRGGAGGRRSRDAERKRLKRAAERAAASADTSADAARTPAPADAPGRPVPAHAPTPGARDGNADGGAAVRGRAADSPVPKRTEEKETLAAAAGAAARPEKRDLDGLADADALVAAFDVARSAVFGAGRRRPAGRDRAVAIGWAEQGGTVAVVEAAVRRQCQRLQAKGHAPPASLALLDDDVAAAIAAARSAPPAAPSAPRLWKGRAEAQWRSLIDSWLSAGWWSVNIAGPAPDEPNCEAPPGLVAAARAAKASGRTRLET